MGYKYIGNDPFYIVRRDMIFKTINKDDLISADLIDYMLQEHPDLIEGVTGGPTAGDYIPETTGWIVGPTGPTGSLGPTGPTGATG
jgi:hypothetical protein